MLRISADVFSGRPNPSWVLTDESEARATLRALAQEPGALADAAPTDAALGPHAGSGRASELAARLIELTSRSSATVGPYTSFCGHFYVSIAGPG